MIKVEVYYSYQLDTVRLSCDSYWERLSVEQAQQLIADLREAVQTIKQQRGDYDK